MIRQACSVDTDCPDGQVCVDGQCSTGDGETGGGTNWLLIGGAIGLAILAIAVIAKEKKK